MNQISRKSVNADGKDTAHTGFPVRFFICRDAQAGNNFMNADIENKYHKFNSQVERCRQKIYALYEAHYYNGPVYLDTLYRELKRTEVELQFAIRDAESLLTDIKNEKS